MKHFQQNLLIVLALALCGLCAFQWREQTAQRREIQTLNGMVFQRDAEIQNDTNSLASLNHQVEQLDVRLGEIKAAAATNEQFIASQKVEIARLQFTNLNLTNTVSQYQDAVNKMEAELKTAYAGIEKQNETITNLVNQRDEFVKKFNDEVNDRNNVVAKYNDLVQQVQKQQSGGK
jgi:chromosome segregation ATPase